ncbi:mucin-2-like isoform X2 [Boleophthalmus pectinirostris]|uniref:mucin-2-like isoform X2 n=1 Tax=Boleophthalmus pectinirostris TaxID=150288 RepID=UPI00242F0B65|nr:mucin-2-like isoform X2 [Boleophthalmus pectinirostris]
MDTEILKHILSCQGSVDREELECNLGDASFIAEIIDSNDKLVACFVSGTPKVVARCRVRLCRARECPGCGGLHLCKNVLFTGVCPFLQSRRGCSFSHELHSEYNMEVLREFGLETLNRTELCLLLLQSNNTLLPQICHDYNNHGCQDDCQRLHVCELYLSFDCKCSRTHDFFAPQPLKLLQEKTIPDHLIKVLKSVYANKEALRLADKENGSNNSQAESNLDANNENELNENNQDISEDTPMDGSDVSDASSSISTKQDQSSVQVTKKRRTRGGKGRNRTKQKNKMPAAATGAELTNPGHGQYTQSSQGPNTAPDSSSASRRGSNTICMFFIRGLCKHGDSCLKAHDKMPYRWQLKQGPFWIPLTQNETIEEDYCDPHNTFSYTNPSIHFDRMKSGQNKVRRLSTVSSVVKPNYSYTTHWIWYWEDEVGMWNQYIPNERGLLSITSKELEEKYVKNNNDMVTFTAESQLIEISFQDMIERNLTYGTKRAVRRRPRFVSEAEVNKNRECTTNITAVSDYLEKMQIAQKGHAQLTTTSSTINEVFSYYLFPPTNLAPTPQVAFTKKFVGLSNFQTAKPANAVSSATAQVASTNKTNVQAALPMTAAATATPAMKSALTTTSRSQFPFTTESQATKSATSRFTSASTTGVNLTTDFSKTPSTSGLKSPMETTTSATKSQIGFRISEASGTVTASAFSASTKSSNPFSPASSAGKSQVTPTTSAASTAPTSGLKSSNQFSTSSDSESSKLAIAKSQFLFDTKPSKSPLMTSQATKSQYTSTFETTAAPKSTSAITPELKSANQSSKSVPVTSQPTKSAPKSTSDIKFSTPGTSSPASTSTKSQLTTLLDPFSPTFPVNWSQMAPTTSATTKSQCTPSTASTSGLKSSNQFSTKPEYSKVTTTSAPTKSQFAFTTTTTPKSTSFSTSGTSSSASTSTKSQLTTSSDPFLSVGRSQMKSTTSATAKSPSTPVTSRKTSGLKSSDSFSTDLTASKSVSKSHSTVSSTSRTNSPDAFSRSSSTRPQLKSKTASDFSTAKLDTPTKLTSVASSTRSRTTPDTTYATKSQLSSATSRPQTRSTAFETEPEFEVETAFTAVSYFESTASSPRPPRKKKSCIIS